MVHYFCFCCTHTCPFHPIGSAKANFNYWTQKSEDQEAAPRSGLHRSKEPQNCSFGTVSMGNCWGSQPHSEVTPTTTGNLSTGLFFTFSSEFLLFPTCFRFIYVFPFANSSHRCLATPATSQTISGSYTTTTTTTTTTSGSGNSSVNSKFSVSSDDQPYPTGQILPTSNLRIFSFADLKAATRNFRADTVLGEGGFGKVFKGWLEEKGASKGGSGTVIAVKKLNSESLQGIEEWRVILHVMWITVPNAFYFSPPAFSDISFILCNFYEILCIFCLPQKILSKHMLCIWN